MERQYSLEGGRIADPGGWRERAAFARELLEINLAQRGLTPKRAPALPPGLEVFGAEIVGPFRQLCVYVMCPVEGLELDAQDDPVTDADGDLVYIYGEPGYFVRVDTLVDEGL